LAFKTSEFGFSDLTLLWSFLSTEEEFFISGFVDGPDVTQLADHPFILQKMEFTESDTYIVTKLAVKWCLYKQRQVEVIRSVTDELKKSCPEATCAWVIELLRRVEQLSKEQLDENLASWKDTVTHLRELEQFAKDLHEKKTPDAQPSIRAIAQSFEDIKFNSNEEGVWKLLEAVSKQGVCAQPNVPDPRTIQKLLVTLRRMTNL
jgi:hypothetical protein